MHNKIINALALTGIFALVGCSDNSSDPTNLLGNLDNPEISSNSEGEEIPPAGEPDITSSETSALPGESSPSGENTPPEGLSSATGENTEPNNTTSSNSGSQQTTSSESAQEQTYAFGYALGNAPRKSKGCGKDPVLKGTEWYQCQKKTSDAWPNADVDCSAQLFSINVNGEKRIFYVTFPENYDKNKPYKLLFAHHCMGSDANHMATWVSADRDHLSPYYAQKAQDKEGNYIFVSPEGNTDGMPWSMFSDKDHRFFSDMLTYLEDNYCIDTTRVFATGFSFGAMFTNSLSWEFQSRIRAVAVYATAIFNIYLPKDGVDRSHSPIAWMGVHGKQDGTCPYLTNNRGPGARDGALVEILKNNSAEGKKAEEEAPEEFNGWGNGHVCYDFKDVDPRFPVKWCSHNGDHQWSATDDGDHSHSWVPQTVHEFFEQF
jgi:poly(3-hydroxybutyrate) depolymerase